MEENATQNNPPQQAAPQQIEIPIATQQQPVTAKAEPSIDPSAHADILAANKVMAAKLKELEAAHSDEAKARQQAEEAKAAARHSEQLQQAQQVAEAALASARRNAIKAHFRGTLRSDSYLKLVPGVEFTEAGDLSAESVEALDKFRNEHAELFTQQSSATTPMSGAGASQSASGIDPDAAAALTRNKIPLPGSDNHWSQRKNAAIIGPLLGHNAGLAPWKLKQ
tara:strand:- start:10483 stop:11154 length:672 start_codon:yes stop_codon:yes gene_type:complete